MNREQVEEIVASCKRAIETNSKAPFVFGTRRIPGSRKRTSLRFADGNQGPKGKVIDHDPKTGVFTVMFHAVQVLKWLSDTGRVRVTWTEKPKEEVPNVEP